MTANQSPYPTEATLCRRDCSFRPTETEHFNEHEDSAWAQSLLTASLVVSADLCTRDFAVLPADALGAQQTARTEPRTYVLATMTPR